jgi:topoisomerase-4 subunit A
LGGFTRDKTYALTKGTPGSRILYFAVHQTEADSDAQNLAVHLKPALFLRNLSLNFPIASLAIKGRTSQGNIVTKHAVDRIVKQRGESK